MFINKINMNGTGMLAMPITTEIISVSGKQNKTEVLPSDITAPRRTKTVLPSPIDFEWSGNFHS